MKSLNKHRASANCNIFQCIPLFMRVADPINRKRRRRRTFLSHVSNSLDPLQSVSADSLPGSLKDPHCSPICHKTYSSFFLFVLLYRDTIHNVGISIPLRVENLQAFWAMIILGLMMIFRPNQSIFLYGYNVHREIFLLFSVKETS